MGVDIDALLYDLVGKDASDLHLKAGQPPVMRIRGTLRRSEFPAIDAGELQDALMAMLSDDRKHKLEDFKELDTSYFIKGLARFRVNMFWQRGKLGAVFRVIPFKIRTIDELRLPQITKSIALAPRGLVLVTGPTGSGKSTSIAAMLNYINVSKRLHIMTIEDPIEYTHEDRISIVNQRELGTDTHTFAEALKHVLRQNPDVILVGEMRDLETIQLAITAAETGHLVLSTLHTVDAPQTIDRIIDVFPPAQQAQIRTQLSVTLQAVISQTLLPKKGGEGRVAAFEVMVATPSVRTLIREAKTHLLYLDLQTGSDVGMQTLDGSLLGLLKDGLIDYDQALAKCSNANEFQRRAINMGLLGTVNAPH